MEILSGDSLISKLKEYISLGYRVYDLTGFNINKLNYKKYIICSYNESKSVYIRPV